MENQILALTTRYIPKNYYQLSGTIPEDIGYLSQLIELDLTDNELSGTLPGSIGNLSQLSILSLRGNKLSGTISKSIGNLYLLTTLKLSYNQYSGTIPEFIGNLLQLSILELASNQLSGSIPESIGNLNQLTTLHLSSNQLSEMPESIGNLTQLAELYLSSNQLSGTIPESIGNLLHLSDLFLSVNQLSGTIPNSIGKLLQLNTLYLSTNQLGGTIPESITNLTQLNTLDMSDNQLSGIIPESIGKLSQVWTLVISSNQISGTIPESIVTLSILNTLDVSGNQLSGTIPESIGNLSLLYALITTYNQISGTIPQSIGNLQRLAKMSLSYNQLSGTIPGNIQSAFLDLSHNQLSGTLPQISHSMVIDVSYNMLGGTIPEAIGNSSILTEIYGHNNQFFGNLTLCNSKNSVLSHIDFSKNNFSDVSWDNLQANCHPLIILLSNNNLKYVPTNVELENLDVSYNQITLTWNEWSTFLIKKLNVGFNPNNFDASQLGDLAFREINDLNLEYNQIYGEIDWDSFKFSSLNLNNNLITGSIKFLPNPTLNYLYLNSNQLKGSLLPVMWNNIMELDVGNNQLYGSLSVLPESLKKLNLENNKFTGTVPSQWKDIKLTDLNLRGNTICGCVPNQWSKLTFHSCILFDAVDCSCLVPSGCTYSCDQTVKTSLCGVNQCLLNTTVCKLPRICEPKVQNNYYYGYECTNCTGHYINEGLSDCAFSSSFLLILILSTVIPGIFLISLVLIYVIWRYNTFKIILPYEWFWDLNRIKLKNYYRSDFEPFYYFKKIESCSKDERELFKMLHNNLDFHLLKVKMCYSIISPHLAQSASNYLKIQQFRMLKEKNLFYISNWIHDDKREKVYKTFVDKCLNYPWNNSESPYVLPVVHATSSKVAWKIASSGFGKLSILDQGYYGKGMYFSTSALYAATYLKENPAILICFAIPGNPYPVIEHPESKESFYGKPIVNRYQSHYCLTTLNGFPYTKDDEETKQDVFDELVVDQESQVVPLFLVKVKVSEDLFQKVVPKTMTQKVLKCVDNVQEEESPKTEKSNLLGRDQKELKTFLN
eukprot:TRINITY_DN10397_c1_g1_i1.p1 TRINITY_DN10397_c1_g1~~TRINITY_DN10397_c1_g1_i1.p1  ORF type:complete len:1129 (+),score=178.07 TRINITY_DN10397_c1_g1_i1:217-3387(+)